MDARSPARASPARALELLDTLVRHDVEFIVVGGVAGLLLGSPIPTLDLEIVYDTSQENIAKLLRALQALESKYRDPAGRHIVPDEGKLREFRMSLLETRLGPLDVLRVIGDGLEYSDLLGRTEEFEVSGFTVRSLNVDALIETKEYANRPKDQNALLFLRKIRQLQNS